MRSAGTTVRRALALGLALTAVACGSETPHVPQAQSSPLSEASVAFKQTGDAPATIDQGTVRYRLDDARLLQITLTLKSTASTPVSVNVQASLYEKSGRLIGDASGGAINVAPNSSTEVRLTGPGPNGTISSATFEVHTVPASTPAH